ncbi:MAG: permease-like cell division protein FtsX [Acidimicrobiia bacterium]
MNNDQAVLERTVRDALHDAADHAVLDPTTPVFAEPRRLDATSMPRRTLFLVAAAIVAVVVGITGVVAFVYRGDKPHVARRASEPEAVLAREVPLDQLTAADVELEVFLSVNATSDWVGAVHVFLETSPEVARFAFVDRDAAWNEFSRIFTCNPDLVSSITPTDLPQSFRIIPTAGGRTSLSSALRAMPEVESVETLPPRDERSYTLANPYPCTNPAR